MYSLPEIKNNTRHNATPVGNFGHPTKRFEHIHLDIVGPLTMSNDFQYCLTIIDRRTIILQDSLRLFLLRTLRQKPLPSNSS